MNFSQAAAAAEKAPSQAPLKGRCSLGGAAPRCLARFGVFGKGCTSPAPMDTHTTEF